MTITSEVTHIEERPDGQLQVRRIDTDSETGEQTVHRHVVVPGGNLDNEDAAVVDVAKKVHTKAVIDAYAAAQPE